MHLGVAFLFLFFFSPPPFWDCGGVREVVCVHYHMLVLPSFGVGVIFTFT
jgi:hypothetical protein